MRVEDLADDPDRDGPSVARLRENDRVTNVAGPNRLRSLVAELWRRVEGAPQTGRPATTRGRAFDAVLALLLVLAGVHYLEAVGEGPAAVVAVLVLVPVFAAAWEIRMWRRRADEGRDRLAALEREQVAALNLAVEHERARIARELHDVVTHNIGMMAIQAGAARKIMDRDPELSREALLAVEAGGRAAMTELRHVMGLLTMDSEGPDAAGAAGLSPQPGLDRLEALVGGVRLAGLPVDLTVTGERRPVPPGIELAAYRVVQEALTNTVKHTVRSGDALLAPAITRRLVERFARRDPGTASVHRDLAALTPREREVMVLLARGLSNAELAARLVLSEATVKTHVARILAKFGLRDRAQAVVVAYETGLVAIGSTDLSRSN